MPVGWRLTGVGYRYPDGPSDLFSMLDLEVAPGQTLVVFGPSGVGKSTLLNLFLGGIQPTQGHIDLLLDNGVIKPLSSFRSRILASVGYVGTDSFIFEGTVFENLTYGLLMPPAQSEVSRALELAECGFVKSLDKGLDYKLTEQGQGLSAGQKQRLSLARALLRNPKILILDEATANLDADIEAKLLTTLLRLKGQMTILAVTHRPSVMMIADLQLDLGRVEYRSN